MFEFTGNYILFLRNFLLQNVFEAVLLMGLLNPNLPSPTQFIHIIKLVDVIGRRISLHIRTLVLMITSIMP